jgi:hypothetical protein
MSVTNKLVVVVELSQRDRNYLRQLASAAHRIANSIAPIAGPGEADIDDE